ncbi:hypothetical protein OG21DRAFT_1527419 [Imleria badia]|nr:hypothetical protein OG21DRAFT_1527419 [Imleria badia]
MTPSVVACHNTTLRSSTGPTSQSRVITPTSHNEPAAPSSHSGSKPPPYWTYNDDNTLDNENEDLPGLQSHEDSPGDENENSSGPQLPGQAYSNDSAQSSNEPSIDELSPDEDERMAEQALQGEYSDVNCYPALLAKGNHNNGFENDPSLLAKGCPKDVVNEHHQQNCFPCPPDPSRLHDIRLQQQNSNAGGQRWSHSGNRVLPILSQVPPTPQATSAPQGPPAPQAIVILTGSNQWKLLEGSTIRLVLHG